MKIFIFDTIWRRVLHTKFSTLDQDPGSLTGLDQAEQHRMELIISSYKEDGIYKSLGD